MLQLIEYGILYKERFDEIIFFIIFSPIKYIFYLEVRLLIVYIIDFELVLINIY